MPVLAVAASCNLQPALHLHRQSAKRKIMSCMQLAHLDQLTTQQRITTTGLGSVWKGRTSPLGCCSWG